MPKEALDLCFSIAATEAQCPGALLVTGDTTSNADMMRAVDAATAIGPIRLLATAAGILGPAKPLTDIDEADWDRLFDINVKGTWWPYVRCYRTCARLAAAQSSVLVRPPG